MSAEDKQREDNLSVDGCDIYLVIDQLIYGKGSLLIQKGQNQIFLKIPVAFSLVHPALGSKPDSVINEETRSDGLIPFTCFF